MKKYLLFLVLAPAVVSAMDTTADFETRLVAIKESHRGPERINPLTDYINDLEEHLVDFTHELSNNKKLSLQTLVLDARRARALEQGRLRGAAHRVNRPQIPPRQLFPQEDQ